MPRVLTRRTLNRTLLARQGLIEPWTCGVAEAIERLIGLQAQAPQAPYTGLFSRLVGFDPDELSRLLQERAVVRIALMRSTLQLVSARDCLRLRPVLAADLVRVLPPALRQRADLAEIAAYARTLLERQPLTFAELAPLLADRFDGASGPDLCRIARNLLALVQPPPRGLWRQSGPAAHQSAQRWLGRPLARSSAPDELIRRYLAAFGPASVADLAAWSGMAGLGSAIRRLGDELDRYVDENGRQLYDLAGTPLTNPDVAVPVRILAEFDNILLGHADRARIFDDRHRGRFMSVNGLVSSTVLIDGFVAGTCTLTRDRQQARLAVTPFAPLRRGLRQAVIEQGERLLAFAAPDTRQHSVTTE